MKALCPVCSHDSWKKAPAINRWTCERCNTTFDFFDGQPDPNSIASAPVWEWRKHWLDMIMEEREKTRSRDCHACQDTAWQSAADCKARVEQLHVERSSAIARNMELEKEYTSIKAAFKAALTRAEKAEAERDVAFEQGISSAIYVVYHWQGPCEADQLARELGYASAKAIAAKAQDDALLCAIADYEAAKHGEGI